MTTGPGRDHKTPTIPKTNQSQGGISMNQIEIFKKVLHAVNLKKYKIKAAEKADNFEGFFYMLVDNPEFSTLNIRFEREFVEKIFGEEFAETGLTEENIFKRNRIWDKGFDLDNIHKLLLLDKKNCYKFLDKFEKFMIELSQTLDGVEYTPGDLCGYVDIGLHGVKMVVKAGVDHDINANDAPIICARIFFITDQETADPYYLQTMYACIHNTTRGMRDDCYVRIPEHRWYHKKGEHYLETDLLIGWNDRFTNLSEIRDKIIYTRTLLKFMEITPNE
jgi:hypothetical protein